MPRRWKVLLVTAVAVFMGFLDVTIVNIAFPDLRADFGGSSLSSLSWVLNAYAIVFAALLVPAGRLADRVGRRRLFLAGLVTFLAASALCGLAPSVPVLVAARVVQAAGAAALVPTSLALLLPEFPLEQRATATALWGATGAVAAATGPSLGGLLVEATGWRAVFLVNLVIGMAAFVPARRLLRESRSEAPGPLADLPGTAALVAGVGLLSLAIVEAPDWGWGSASVLGALAGAAALLAWVVDRSRRAAAPVVDLELYRVRSFAVANLGVLLLSVGFYALLLGNVLFLTGVWGWSILHAGVALTPGPVMATLGSAAGGRLADRFGQRVVALPGALLLVAGCAVFATATGATPRYASEFLPATLLTGTGIGLSFAAWGSAAVAELPPSRFATGSALFACARQIGAVLGIAGLVAVLGTPAPEEALGAAHAAWLLMAAPVLGSAACALALGRVHARDPEASVTP
ncbi:MAG TPA: DHA2 family efflux MFS transporter permease subunit, partial [Solirubrobacteraceae bacterium]|nr:DHA2 family efflux MFS transporter permease subunit [Solirubrobacteraceae bacterium]